MNQPEYAKDQRRELMQAGSGIEGLLVGARAFQVNSNASKLKDTITPGCERIHAPSPRSTVPGHQGSPDVPNDLIPRVQLVQVLFVTGSLSIVRWRCRKAICRLHDTPASSPARSPTSRREARTRRQPRAPGACFANSSRGCRF